MLYCRAKPPVCCLPKMFTPWTASNFSSIAPFLSRNLFSLVPSLCFPIPLFHLCFLFPLNPAVLLLSPLLVFSNLYFPNVPLSVFSSPASASLIPFSESVFSSPFLLSLRFAPASFSAFVPLSLLLSLYRSWSVIISSPSFRK